jgi:hypothetical protein
MQALREILQERMKRMKVEIDLDEAEVLALRTGGQVPLSLRDKLGDAVHIREVGWYLVTTEQVPNPRPRWWDGTNWWWGPDRKGIGHPAVIEHWMNEPIQRLYTEDER